MSFPEETALGFKPETSFYAHLMHKLNCVIWAEGSKAAAARRLHVKEDTVYRWIKRLTYPNHTTGPRLDAAYLLALEKLQHYRRRREARRLRRLRRVPSLAGETC